MWNLSRKDERQIAVAATCVPKGWKNVSSSLFSPVIVGRFSYPPYDKGH